MKTVKIFVDGNSLSVLTPSCNFIYLQNTRHHTSKQRSIRFQSLINTFVTRHSRIFSKGINPHSPKGSKSLRAHAKPNSAFSFSLSSEIKTSPRPVFSCHHPTRHSIVTRHLHWPAGCSSKNRSGILSRMLSPPPPPPPANDSYRLLYSLPKASLRLFAAFRAMANEGPAATSTAAD